MIYSKKSVIIMIIIIWTSGGQPKEIRIILKNDNSLLSDGAVLFF